MPYLSDLRPTLVEEYQEIVLNQQSKQNSHNNRGYRRKSTIWKLKE